MTARPRWTALALAGIVVVGAALLWTQAIQVHLWAPDEEYFVQLSRLISEHFPGGVVHLPVQPFDQRGIQRLTILLLAWPLGVVDGKTGIELGRALMCLAFASAAVPAYLLARGVRLPAGWSLLTAALTVLVPWSVLTGSFLTESVAYPAALWAIWGAWRACVVPGWRSDVLALALVVAAGLARTNLLVLITVAPIAVLLQTLASAGRRDTPRALWRDHPIYAVLIIPGAIVAVLNLAGVQPGPLARLSGNYITSLGQIGNAGELPAKMAHQVATILTGLGVIPVLVGLPWMVRQALRRTSPETGALAITGLVGFLVVLFSTVYAAPEERYLMLAAPFLLVPGVVAIARRAAPPWAITAAALLAAVLVWRTPWKFTSDQSFMLTDPSESFVARVVLSHLPGAGQLPLGLLVLAGGLVVAFALGRRRWAWAAVAVAALLVLVQVVQTGYSVTKRTQLAGAAGTLADWTWVDDSVGGSQVGIQAVGQGNSGLYDLFWRDINFFNRRSDVVVATGPVAIQIPRYGTVTTATVDDRTGRLSAAGGPIPRYMLQPDPFRPQGLLADTVIKSPELPVRLVKLRGAPRVTYEWSGTELDGWLSSEQRTAGLQMFPPALKVGARPCLTLTLGGPPAAYVRTPARYDVRGAGVRRSGRLRPDGRVKVVVPLRTGHEHLTVRSSSFGAKVPTAAVWASSSRTRPSAAARRHRPRDDRAAGHRPGGAPMTTAVGIDWHRRGWVGVILRPPAAPEVLTDAGLEALVARAPDAACVGVDMPIGLRDHGLRPADDQARRFVGPRRSSVFMTPPAAVLRAASYAEANAIAPGLTGGRKISRQAWALRRNIAVVDRLARADPRLIEVHPEVSFCAMAGAHIPFAKGTWNGQHLRRRLLAEQGIDLPDTLDRAGDVPVADVLDAAAVAWTALRHARGEAGSLPPGAPPGARHTIWY